MRFRYLFFFAQLCQQIIIAGVDTERGHKKMFERAKEESKKRIIQTKREKNQKKNEWRGKERSSAGWIVVLAKYPWILDINVTIHAWISINYG